MLIEARGSRAKETNEYDELLPLTSSRKVPAASRSLAD